MLIQCLSETISNSWWKTYFDWSDKCAPVSLESIILVFIFSYLLFLLHKFIFYYLKSNNLANNLTSLISIFFHEKRMNEIIDDLSGYELFKFFIAILIVILCLLFYLACLYFLADFVLNYFGWTVDKRTTMRGLISNLLN
jgi:succinate dehydrogenase hydrophobic anchor subunit